MTGSDRGKVVVSGKALSMPQDAAGSVSMPFEFQVPRARPVSYDGRLVLAAWTTIARQSGGPSTEDSVTVKVTVIHAGQVEVS